MNAEKEQKQNLLEVPGLKARVEKSWNSSGRNFKFSNSKTTSKAGSRPTLRKQQREFFLHQQMKQIQEELGSDPHKEDIAGKKARAEAQRLARESGRDLCQGARQIGADEHPKCGIQRAIQLSGPAAGPALEHHLGRQLRPGPCPGDIGCRPLRIGERSKSASLSTWLS